MYRNQFQAFLCRLRKPLGSLDDRIDGIAVHAASLWRTSSDPYTSSSPSTFREGSVEDAIESSIGHHEKLFIPRNIRRYLSEYVLTFVRVIVILTTSTLLPAYAKSGTVDQKRLLECHHEEKRDILVTWFLDLSQSLSRREGKPLPVYRSHS